MSDTETPLDLFDVVSAPMPPRVLSAAELAALMAETFTAPSVGTRAEQDPQSPHRLYVRLIARRPAR